MKVWRVRADYTVYAETEEQAIRRYFDGTQTTYVLQYQDDVVFDGLSEVVVNPDEEVS